MPFMSYGRSFECTVYVVLMFSQEGLHPFAKALADFLFECNARSMRLGVVKPFMRAANAKYEEDKTILVSYVNDSQYAP